MTWRYRAADAEGRESRGVVQASSIDDARAQLRTRALWVIELTPEPRRGGATPSNGPGDARATWTARIADVWARWSGDELESLAAIMRGIATLLEAGVPAERALAFAAVPAEGDTSRGSWPAVFGALQRAVIDGASLSAAMQREPRLPVAMAPSIAAAEATGTLPETFARLASSLERQAATQARVRAALVYPGVLALSSIVGTLVIMLVVVPRFAALVSDGGAPLPVTTQLLIGLSSFVSRGGWVLLPLGAAAATWWQRSLRDPSRATAWDARRLSWPVFGRYERDRNAARYLDTLSLALTSGVSLLQAMALARSAVQNRALASQLEPAEARVRDGAPLVEAIGDALPPLARQLLRAGEAGGSLGMLAGRAAAAAESHAERQLGRVVALIEPVMILGFGGVVALVALALLQAIYGLNAGML